MFRLAPVSMTLRATVLDNIADTNTWPHPELDTPETLRNWLQQICDTHPEFWSALSITSPHLVTHS